MGGTRCLWLLYPHAQTLGAHSGLLQVPPSARQPGLFPCSSHPRQKLLPEPASATPLLPNCHSPLPAIPPFRLSFPYIVSVSPVKCYFHHYCSTSSIFLIINVILIQQIPEVPQPSCESISVLSLETYLI